MKNRVRTLVYKDKINKERMSLFCSETLLVFSGLMQFCVISCANSITFKKYFRA